MVDYFIQSTGIYLVIPVYLILCQELTLYIWTRPGFSSEDAHAVMEVVDM